MRALRYLLELWPLTLLAALMVCLWLCGCIRVYVDIEHVDVQIPKLWSTTRP